MAGTGTLRIARDLHDATGDSLSHRKSELARRLAEIGDVVAAREALDVPRDDRREPLALEEALALVATHGTIAEIADRLGLSEGTVRNHLSAAIQKVGARNRAEAARIAAGKGWLAPETTG